MLKVQHYLYFFVQDLKADVHRKNSSESSEELSIHPPSIVTSIVKSSASPFRLAEMFEGDNDHYFRPSDPLKREHKRQKSSTDGFVSISITDESNKVPTLQSSFRKLSRQPSTDSQASSLVIEHRPSLQSVNEASTNNYSIMTSGKLTFLLKILIKVLQFITVTVKISHLPNNFLS